jgi:hypothetical protein
VQRGDAYRWNACFRSPGHYDEHLCLLWLPEEGWVRTQRRGGELACHTAAGRFVVPGPGSLAVAGLGKFGLLGTLKNQMETLGGLFKCSSCTHLDRRRDRAAVRKG